MRHYRKSLALAALLGACLLLSLRAAAVDFLNPDQAFQLSAERHDRDSVKLQWQIAPGYKLYRKSIEISSGQESLGEPAFPDGKRAFDENLGEEVETYHDALSVSLPVRSAPGSFNLQVRYQGCAEAGLCYPPITKTLTVAAADSSGDQDVSPARSIIPAKTEALPDAQEDAGALAQRTLQSGSLWRIGLVFLTFGVLLSLTPCVLPMVPILSSIIVGDGVRSKRRGFLLALTYSLGMALVYTSLGVAAGWAGEGLAGALQQPWVLAVFALLMVMLALSMFDVYQLQMPAALQTRLALASDKQKGGRFASVFVMGAISALIVGPCITAPLAGALVYISQTRDVVIGGWALFSMAAGMSVLLLLTGLSAGALLPRAGGWMNKVKHSFGLVLIAVAIWMVHPILPGWLELLAWGAFGVLCAIFLGAFEPLPPQKGVGSKFAKAAGWVFLVLGVLQLVGAASGGDNALQPLSHIRVSENKALLEQTAPQFNRIRSVAELKAVLATSTAPVMLDFYADWCVACKEMEHMTFRDNQVAGQLNKFVLLQADVTSNSPEDRELLKRFNLYGPPGIIFFNHAGEEVPQSRIIGFLNADAFLAHIERHLAGYM